MLLTEEVLVLPMFTDDDVLYLDADGSLIATDCYWWWFNTVMFWFVLSVFDFSTGLGAL